MPNFNSGSSHKNSNKNNGRIGMFELFLYAWYRCSVFGIQKHRGTERQREFF